MLKENLSYIITMGVASIVCIVIGLYGILNKEKSNHFRSVNALIAGGMLFCLSVFYLYYVINWNGAMSKDIFYNCLMIGFVIYLFIGGMYGVLNRKKIDDPIAFRFSRQAMIISIMGLVFLVLFWLRWHR